MFIAKQDGKVVSVSDSFLNVEYADGTKQGYALGVKHGEVAGDIIPHMMTSDFKKDMTFKSGYVLAWNKGFFVRDPFNKYNVLYASGTQATVALMEGNDVLEDGSAISPRLAKKLTTSITKRKGIVIEYDQDVSELVKVGDVLTYDSTLCLIKEATTSGLENDDGALLALSKLSNKNPKAKINGVVSRVEVFYMGDYEEASDSLKALIETDNKRRLALAKTMGNKKTGRTGQVRKPVFIAGEKLTHGKVIISIYIDVVVEAGIGDKSSVANQLKTVHGRIMNGVNETEDGVPIDIRFGSSSVMARIVYSVFIQGTMNKVFSTISKQLADEYMEAGD